MLTKKDKEFIYGKSPRRILGQGKLPLKAGFRPMTVEELFNDAVEKVRKGEAMIVRISQSAPTIDDYRTVDFRIRFYV